MQVRQTTYSKTQQKACSKRQLGRVKGFGTWVLLIRRFVCTAFKQKSRIFGICTFLDNILLLEQKGLQQLKQQQQKKTQARKEEIRLKLTYQNMYYCVLVRLLKKAH